MAMPEDAANVLEQFIHDVANLPAEIAHLYEEAQAKQDMINECYSVINSRDGNIQKFIKQNGSLVINPKEDEYSNTVKKNFLKAQELQEEKLALFQKSCVLVDRYVKRLDIKLRDLQTEGAMPIDHSMPSLLRESPGNLVAPSSSTNTGANTPLQPLSLNTTGGQANVAQAAINKVTRAIAGAGGSNSTIIGMQPHPLINRAIANNGVPNVAALQLNRSQREASASSDRKRPRPEGTLGTLPARPSNLARQSSLGPGTPKAGTPGGSRAGSVGPRAAKRPVAGKRPDLKMNRKKISKHGLSKKVNRRLNNLSRASPSTTGDDSVASEDGSDAENDPDHDMDSADADDDGADDTKYCYCQRVSYGDMVACDNADCKNQWFHWECAGLVAEPVGDWLCRDCAKLPKSKIRKA